MELHTLLQRHTFFAAQGTVSVGVPSPVTMRERPTLSL